MKKVLLGTSAIALLGAATTANAAEWDIQLGGYMEQHVGFASYDSAAGTDFDGVDVKSDQEFYFRPQITLDNGLKISARMDFEGNSAGGVDEPRIIISGSFGSITLGEDDMASYDVMVAAPNVSSLGVNSGSSTTFQPGGGIFGTSNGQMTRTTYPQHVSDPVGIKYFSPRFAGFQIGASYARDGNQSANDAQIDIDDATGGQRDRTNNLIGLGANYTNSFGGFNVAASAGWGLADVTSAVVGQATDTHEVYAFGLNLGFGGFTIGGSWGEANNDNGVGTNDGRTYDAGVSYETGPWGFSFTYLHSERADGAGGDDEIDEFMLAADYDLAKGVQVEAFGLYTTQDDASAVGVDNDGFVIGSSIRVDF